MDKIKLIKKVKFTLFMYIKYLLTALSLNKYKFYYISHKYIYIYI